MTRNGKIARLPKTVREQLNVRLENGTPGSRVVEWLNALPEVRAVLVAEFGGQSIDEQNLTAWRQGGYQDWVRHQEARAWVRQMAEESRELATAAGELPLAEHLSAPLAVMLSQLLREAVGELYERKIKERGQVPPELLAFVSKVTSERAKAAGLSAEELRSLGIKLNQGESR